MERVPDLLADLGWLHKLARSLLDDPELANEAVQDTCTIALERGEQAVAHRRAWLATVLRNCARLQLRRRRSAMRRERQAAREESGGEDAGELLARAELQGRLVEAVLALPEAYRDVVLMRFFDGLPPRVIARRTNIPVATVHSRLQRALGQLRGVLDRGDGGRAGWGLVALTLPPATSFLPALSIVMQTKVKLVVAACVAACTLTFFWPETAEGGNGAVPFSNNATQRRDAGGSGGGGAGSGAGAASANSRRRIEAPPQSPPPPAVERVAVRGRVRDCSGNPLPRAQVIAANDPGAEPAVTDGAGIFEIHLIPADASMRLQGERYVTVFGANWSPESSFEPIIIAAPAIGLGGVVTNESGARVQGANVTVQLPDDFNTRVSLPLDRAQRTRWDADTDTQGVFAMNRVPQIEGAQIVVVAPAYRPLTIDVPVGGNTAMELVMTPFAYQEGQLQGIVVDVAGAPVAGARVAMGVTSVVADERGAFQLLLRHAGWPTAITAAKAGYLPGRVEVPESGGGEPEDWPERIVVTMGLSPLSIHGVVRDESGNALAGALVWIADPTLLGIAGMMPTYVEYLAAGGAVPPYAARMRVPARDEPTRDDMYFDNTSTVGAPTAGWWFVETGEGGAFELAGLMQRDYTVRAFDPVSGTMIDRVGVPAGTTTELTVSRDGLWKQVRGRVVAMSGAPVAGVSVTQVARLFTASERVPGGRFEGNAIREVAMVRTDAQGYFEFEDVSKERTAFGFSSDDILPRALDGEDIANPLEVVVQVQARCHVEVQLVDPLEGDKIHALDHQGNRVEISVLRSGSHQATTGLPLHEGKSGVFVLGENAAMLHLVKDDAVVREIPLVLRPGETVQVQ